MSTTASKRYRIKDLSEIAEMSRRAIRYYVQRGLLDPPLGAGRGSYYTAEHLKQLLAIKESQENGYSLEEIEAQKMNEEEAHLQPNSSASRNQSPAFLTQDPSQSPRILSSQHPHTPHAHTPPPYLSSKSYPSNENPSTSTWLRLQIDEQIEIHLKAGTLSSSELEDFRVHILDFFRSKPVK